MATKSPPFDDATTTTASPSVASPPPTIPKTLSLLNDHDLGPLIASFLDLTSLYAYTSALWGHAGNQRIDKGLFAALFLPDRPLGVTEVRSTSSHDAKKAFLQLVTRNATNKPKNVVLMKSWLQEDARFEADRLYRRYHCNYPPSRKHLPVIEQEYADLMSWYLGLLLEHCGDMVEYLRNPRRSYTLAITMLAARTVGGAAILTDNHDKLHPTPRLDDHDAPHTELTLLDWLCMYLDPPADERGRPFRFDRRQYDTGFDYEYLHFYIFFDDGTHDTHETFRLTKHCWPKIREKVLEAVAKGKAECDGHDDETNLEGYMEAIAAEKGTEMIDCTQPMATDDSEAADLEMVDLMLDMIDESHEYRPTKEEVEARQDVVLEKFQRLETTIGEYEWEDAGFMDRSNLQLVRWTTPMRDTVVEEAGYWRLGSQLSRSSLDYLHLLLEEIHFGRGWHLRLADGSDCYMVLGRQGSLFYVIGTIDNDDDDDDGKRKKSADGVAESMEVEGKEEDDDDDDDSEYVPE